MKNFFTDYRGVTLTFGDMEEKADGMEFVDVLLERVSDKKVFDFIVTQIPGFKVYDSRGFSDDEIKQWIEYTMRNSVIIWEVAKEKRAEKLA